MSDDANYLAGARARVVQGGPGTGLTGALAREAAALLQAGAPVGELLLVGASPTAAQALACRVAALAGVDPDELRVETPLSLGRAILDAARLARCGAVRARVLEPFEREVFFEDMKVTGVKERRLRELVKFLERGWSEMRDGQEGWLVTGEEKLVASTVRSRLEALGACLPCEVCAQAVRVMAGGGATDRVPTSRWVVADGYRAMGRAGQRLVRLLAGEGLVVGWDNLGGLRGEEPCGYDEGLDELVAEAGEALGLVVLERSVQAPGPARALANVFSQRCLAGRGGCGARDGGAPNPEWVRGANETVPGCGGSLGGMFEVHEYGDLAQEMDLVADAVVQALERGDRPEEVFVAVPTDAWGQRAARALGERGVPASALPQKPVVSGSFRGSGGSGAMAVCTALRLVADPQDGPALRCWVARGDYLGLSPELLPLYGECGERSMGLAGLLAEKNAAGCLSPVLAERLRALGDLRAEVQGLRGTQLVEALCARLTADGAVPLELAALWADSVEGADAARLTACVARRSAWPAFGPGVRVGGWDLLLGQTPKTLVLCGLANGLVPRAAYFDLERASADAQDRMHERLAARLAQVAGAPSEALVCTAFTQAGLVEAEKLGLVSRRVRLQAGRRVCELTPSACVRYLCGELLERQTV